MLHPLERGRGRLRARSCRVAARSCCEAPGRAAASAVRVRGRPARELCALRDVEVVATVVAGSDWDERVRPARRSLARLAGIEIGADEVLGTEERRAARVEDEEVHFRRSSWKGP